MITDAIKGGTGTASRLVRIGGSEDRPGALVQANPGLRGGLTLPGRPVDRLARRAVPGPEHRVDHRHPRQRRAAADLAGC